MVDINPNTKFILISDVTHGKMAAILHVYIPKESTGHHEYIEIGLNQSTLLDLNLSLDLTLLNDSDASLESKQVDWVNEDGSLNVKGDRNKLTLIVNLRDIGNVIRPLDEEESNRFRMDVKRLI